MKINHLTVSGFGPFRSEQRVDFSDFDGDLFLIDGNTGAGKSSILDAITYALYNNVARYDAKVGEKVRSNYCTPAEKTEVVLDFSLKEGRYRITRNPEYDGLRKNSDRTAVRKSDATLERFDTRGWVGMSAGLRDVGADLERILPLSKSQFLQVILLAQNKFAEFLHSPSSDRQKLLRALFHTERFDLIEQELRTRKSALDTSLGRVTDRAEARSAAAQSIIVAAGLAKEPADELAEELVEELVDAEAVGTAIAAGTATASGTAVVVGTALAGLPLTVAGLEHYLGLVTVAATAATATLAARQQSEAKAQAELTALNEAKARQEALLFSLAKRAVLEAQSDQIAADEVRLMAAERAESVRAALETRDAAAVTAAAAAQATVAAREEWAALNDHATDSDSSTENTQTSMALKAEVKACEKTLTELALAEKYEGEVTEREEEIAALTATVAQLSEEAITLTEQTATLPAAITAAEIVVQDIALKAVQRVAVTAETDAARKRLAAAQTVITLQSKHQDLLAVEAIRTTESAQASHAVATLLERQLDGYAATLASSLEDGDPCMVCGSTTHPQLATGLDTGSGTGNEHGSVTAEDIEQARIAETNARTAQANAQAATTTVLTDIAAQSSVADGLSVEKAQVALEVSAARLQEITDAVATTEASTEAVRELTTRFASLTASIDANRHNLATSSASLVAAEQSLLTATRARNTARAGFASVGERRKSIEALRAVADHYLDALLASDVAEATRANGQISLAEGLTKHGFATEIACTEALLPSATLQQLRTSTANHRAELTTHNDIISAAAAEGITEAPIDTDAAQEALRELKEQAVASHEFNVLARKRAEDFAALVDTARTDEAENAQLLSKFQTVNTLSRLTAGDDPNTFKMRLESFVLAAKLEEIVQAANKRLSSMTQERYALEYDDELAGNAKSGLGISVLDNFTGQSRSAKSLSGGETFLASLALALGLAEVVSSQAGGIRLDTLFIDEGFGALDSGTLAIAMNTIHELRAGGRTIGLISHVEEMKQQILNKLHVVKTKDGSSSIRSEA